MSGVHQPVYLHPDYEFYPIHNGFALKYLRKNEEEIPIDNTLLCRKIEAFNNNEKKLFYPDASIPHRLNNLRFECIVPNQDNVLYQFRLNDSDNWSSWDSDNFFIFLNLNPGEHNLFVRALVNDGMTDTSTISVRIAAPWYRSIYAYIIYFLLIVSVAFLIRSWQKFILRKQKKKLLLKEQNSLREQAEKHRQKIMLMEQERLKIEYDQIKEQLRSKTIELANKAKDSEDKNRLLLSLKEKCANAQKNPSLSKIRWGEMQRLLDSYLKFEDKTFEIQMDELHQDFFKKLKEQFPNLSNHDLRVCAYLKIGLTSKEIADILNILPSSAYITRSRLRQKLSLQAEEDLYDFLNRI